MYTIIYSDCHIKHPIKTHVYTCKLYIYSSRPTEDASMITRDTCGSQIDLPLTSDPLLACGAGVCLRSGCSESLYRQLYLNGILYHESTTGIQPSSSHLYSTQHQKRSRGYFICSLKYKKLDEVYSIHALDFKVMASGIHLWRVL